MLVAYHYQYSRTPLIRPPSESHWCGRIRGMVAREGFVYEQKPLSVTRNVVVWEGWSLVRVVVRQGFYCTINWWSRIAYDVIRAPAEGNLKGLRVRQITFMDTTCYTLTQIACTTLRQTQTPDTVTHRLREWETQYQRPEPEQTETEREEAERRDLDAMADVGTATHWLQTGPTIPNYTRPSPDSTHQLSSTLTKHHISQKPQLYVSTMLDKNKLF